jgi:hypothetical protein
MSPRVFAGSVRYPVLLRSLRRLVRQAKRQVFLIRDRHRAPEAAAVERWLRRPAARIAVFPLPRSRPELNPGADRDQDVKGNAVRPRRPHDKPEMMPDLRSYRRGTPGHPAVVRSYFRHRATKYAQD